MTRFLRTPYRFDNRDPLKVYAVYACEVDCLDDTTPLSWMLLTIEAVTTIEMAATILRWYSYRWRVEGTSLTRKFVFLTIVLRKYSALGSNQWKH